MSKRKTPEGKSPKKSPKKKTPKKSSKTKKETKKETKQTRSQKKVQQAVDIVTKKKNSSGQRAPDIWLAIPRMRKNGP